MNVEWKVFYDDGSVYDSETPVRELPRRGVEIIAQYNDKTGYDLLYSDGDYFVYDPDRGGWRFTDQFGMYDHLLTVENPLVLFGREMAHAQFWELLRKVKEHCGNKSAWLRTEKRPK